LKRNLLQGDQKKKEKIKVGRKVPYWSGVKESYTGAKREKEGEEQRRGTENQKTLRDQIEERSWTVQLAGREYEKSNHRVRDLNNQGGHTRL